MKEPEQVTGALIAVLDPVPVLLAAVVALTEPEPVKLLQVLLAASRYREEPVQPVELL